MWCGTISRGLIGQVVNATVTGLIYLNMLQQSVMPRIKEIFEDKKINFSLIEDQHTTIVMYDPYHNAILPNRLIGSRDFIEYTPRQPAHTLLEFFMGIL